MKFSKSCSIRSACCFIFLLISCVLLFTGCQNNHGTKSVVRSSTLLDNVVSEDEKEYRFEQIPWLTEKKELIENGHISPDNVTTLPDGESIKLSKDVKFKVPQTEAMVIYKFESDEFVGGEYVISAETEDELVQISMKLKNMLAERFPKPSANTLDELSEDTIRDRTSSIIQWWGKDNSGFSISIPDSQSEFILIISVYAPK